MVIIIYLLIVGAVGLTCSEDDIGHTVPPITDQIHSAQLLRRMQTDLLNNLEFVCDICGWIVTSFESVEVTFKVDFVT